jgi:hypothetical protein
LFSMVRKNHIPNCGRNPPVCGKTAFRGTSEVANELSHPVVIVRILL